MMRRRVFKFLFAAALGLTLFDSVADTVVCDSPASACHACSCGPHLVSPAVLEVAAVAAPPAYVSYKPSSYSFLLHKSLLRPPCLPA
ncbi:MAG: hypothetical protein Q8T11_00475 [Elusimicrobiota bacterium]|nr:hypothetical protein [Elusimicrobiota bacterium]